MKTGYCGTRTHDYKRHGTTTLFAALNAFPGKVVGRHYARRRRVEFSDVLNRGVGAYPDKEIHVRVDTLSQPTSDYLERRGLRISHGELTARVRSTTAGTA